MEMELHLYLVAKGKGGTSRSPPKKVDRLLLVNTCQGYCRPQACIWICGRNSCSALFFLAVVRSGLRLIRMWFGDISLWKRVVANELRIPLPKCTENSRRQGRCPSELCPPFICPPGRYSPVNSVPLDNIHW